MGVNKLWQLLKDEGERSEKLLSQCRGETWAVDLSGWIMHARSAAKGISALGCNETMVRTVFYRALCLLKNGIRPVIVMDGRKAPTVKSQTLKDRSQRQDPFQSSAGTANDRAGLLPLNSMCQTLLKSLGLQVITSSGEAEKTCALLNIQGIVDACLTDDSDVFLYGATKVYRNLDVKKEVAEEHTLAGIEEKLKLGRRDLVLMGLLSGCDYGHGLAGVGPKKVCGLVAAMKVYCSDALDRVCHWRDSPDLISLEQRWQSCTKLTHCSVCQHPGTKSQHRKEGCRMCGSHFECNDNSVRCTCDYHVLAQYKTELDMRKKAIQCRDFPDQQLLEEFMDDTETLSVSKVEVVLPTWEALADTMRLTQEVVLAQVIPVLIHLHLHGILDLAEAKPIRLLKECVQNFIPCYQVSWNRFGFDKWTPQPYTDVEKTPQSKGSNDPYVVVVPRDLFFEKYPAIVEEWQKCPLKKAKNKRVEDSPQSQITDSFKVTKVKKVLHFD